MILLSAKDMTKAYGTDTILQDVTFLINKGDRVGLIGVNGAGKTTLLKILAGELSRDSGELFVSRESSIGYLKQNKQFQSQNTVLEETEAIFSHLKAMEEQIMRLADKITEHTGTESELQDLLSRQEQLQEEFKSKGGYTYKSEIKGILTSMAFDPNFYDKKISTLSGGEKTRLALACLLLKKPDILFLDEPTNHLDIGTLKWLEQYLKSYKGTILLVSHDRYFLDQTVTRIFELEHRQLSSYEGDYSTFAEKKRAAREADFRLYEKQQKEIGRQEEMIRRFKQHGTEKLAKRALSREKQLAHIEQIKRPDTLPGKMKLRFKQNFKSGTDVFLGEDLAKSFGYGASEKKLFAGVSFDIKKGDRICLVGPNGIGKTTLLRLIAGEMKPDRGTIKIGHNVDIGYYDQGQQRLNEEHTVLEELKDAYRLYTDTEMRSILGRFLFTGDDVFLPIKAISGGEKARLALAKLMLSGANTLILDEPTNHLDINSREVFEDALSDFPGTMIVVSHDRYFLNKIPDKIFELGQRGISTYLGTYNYYIEKKQEISSGKQYLHQLAEKKNGKIKETEKSKPDSGRQRQLQKEKEAQERRKKRYQTKVEEDIAALEARISQIEQEINLPETATDREKLTVLSRSLAATKKELSLKYDEWAKF